MKRTRAIIIASAIALAVAGGTGIAIAVATAPSSSELSAPLNAGTTAQPDSSHSGDAASGSPTQRPAPREHAGNSSGPDAPSEPTPATEAPRILPGAAPAIANALGRLATSFPETVPPAPQSQIQSSSLTSEGSSVQLTLAARTTLPQPEILDFYRAQFAQYGLIDVPAPAVEGSTALLFTRDDDSITLTVTPVDGGVDYIVFGALTARG